MTKLNTYTHKQERDMNAEPITLSDLASAIDDMYCQLDKDKIDEWEVDGMDILINGELYTLNIKEAAE